jgi:hypothetical protein
MLKNEAIWLGKEIEKLPKSKIGTILDLGSSSLFFRSIRHPYINKYIFTPLIKRGIVVLHTDIELDVTDGSFTKRVNKMDKVNTVFAFNLLEHVTNYKKAAKNIASVVPKGGYLFVSSPKKFPYHPDPIDNGFRPTPTKIANLFPKTIIIKKAIINQKKIVMITRNGILLNQKYSASCLILKKVKP